MMRKKDNPPDLPNDLLQRIKAIRAKRPHTVLEHLLKHGHITTEELQDLYGYEHPPRAARDVREQGIPLRTFKVRDKKGRKIAAYRLDLEAIWEEHKAGGRKAFSKGFKASLIERYGSRCISCGTDFESRFLQVDHRVPYEVAGEEAGKGTADFMLLCPSCNRTKSWTCEHCRNWQKEKRVSVCQSCYWGDPIQYNHIALAEMRRVEVTWVGEEVKTVDRFRRVCEARGISMQQAIKDILETHASVKKG